MDIVKHINYFRCNIRGEYFPGEIISKDNFVGFYTYLIVLAYDENMAKIISINKIKKHNKIKHCANTGIIYVDNVFELTYDTTHNCDYNELIFFSHDELVEKDYYILACINNKIDTILEIYSDKNIYLYNELGLEIACICNNIDIIDWFINLYINYSDKLLTCCLYGHFDLIVKFCNIDSIIENNCYLFRIVCYLNYLNVSQYLYSFIISNTTHTFNIDMYDICNNVYLICCELHEIYHNYTNIINWLHNIINKINICE